MKDRSLPRAARHGRRILHRQSGDRGQTAIDADESAFEVVPIGHREALHITIVVTEHGADTMQRLLGPIRDGKCQLGAPTVGAGLGPKQDAWHGLAFHIIVCEVPVRLDLPYIVA